MNNQKFTVEVTRKEFLELPMKIRRRTLRNQATRCTMLACINSLALALTGHKHKWTPGQRKMYEDAVS